MKVVVCSQPGGGGEGGGEDVKGSHRAELLTGSIRPLFPSRRSTPRGVMAGFHSSNAFKHRRFRTMCLVMIVTSGSMVPFG